MQDLRYPGVVVAWLLAAIAPSSLITAQEVSSPASAAAAQAVTPAPSATVQVGTTPAVPAASMASLVPDPITPTTEISDPSWDQSLGKIDTSHGRGSFPARLTNLSARARIGGTDPLIAGATVSGSTTLPMLVRAIGPGLAQFHVSEAVPNAQLAVYRGTTLVARTNVASSASGAVAVFDGAFPTAQSNLAIGMSDAALVGRGGAGTFTAVCTATSSSGSLLTEFYDSDAAASATTARFINLSARAQVTANDGLVVGFVIAGQGNLRLLLRGVGPSLSQFGVGGILLDPKIELYSGSTLIASNADWQDGGTVSAANVAQAANSVGAFALQNNSDAAMIVTLQPGAYTLLVTGSTPTTTPTPANALAGAVLGEIYELGPAAASPFDAAVSTNAVGLDLFRTLAPDSPGNLILSPYSIESALALAYAGADGDTRTQMAAVLHLPADNATLQIGFSSLRTALADAAVKSIPIAQKRSVNGAHFDPIEWNAANRLFGQTGYSFRSSFLSLMSDGFGAPFQAMDFGANPDESGLTINGWVEDQTHQRIQNLIPPGALSSATRLVLVNALYLKAPWDSPFDIPAAPDTFHLTSTTTSTVPTMAQTMGVGYSHEPGFTVATLPYLGNELQFVVILPDAGQTPDTIAAQLTPERIASWSNLPNQTVVLHLPKFKVPGVTVPLGAVLRKLGMTNAFDVPPGSANFDGIAPRTPGDYLSISDVFHQTFVAVDEQGTEAAAATAVVMTTASTIMPPPPDFRVDHPFLFAIQHRASGACLFLGRITNPTWQ